VSGPERSPDVTEQHAAVMRRTLPRYLDGWSRSYSPGTPTRLPPISGDSRLRDSAGFAPDFPWTRIRVFSCCGIRPRTERAVKDTGFVDHEAGTRARMSHAWNVDVAL
jgi:hypothetical protein